MRSAAPLAGPDPLTRFLCRHGVIPELPKKEAPELPIYSVSNKDKDKEDDDDLIDDREFEEYRCACSFREGLRR